jgi:hypothetical protein
MSAREASLIEKRHHSRAKVAWPVFAEYNRKIINGEAINISHSGALIFIQEPIEPGEVFEMAVSVPFGYRPIRTIAEVVRPQTTSSDVDYGPYGMGVHFLMISKEDRKLILTRVAGHPDKKSGAY